MIAEQSHAVLVPATDPGPTRFRHPGLSLALRMVAVVAVAALLAGPFLVAILWAMIVATDCFMSCGDNAQPVVGHLIMGLPALLLASWVALVAAAFGRRDRAGLAFRRVMAFGWLAGVVFLGVILANG